MGPLTHSSPYSKWYLDWFGHFRQRQQQAASDAMHDDAAQYCLAELVLQIQ